jgi:hypothetical protein
MLWLKLGCRQAGNPQPGKKDEKNGDFSLIIS